MQRSQIPCALLGKQTHLVAMEIPAEDPLNTSARQQRCPTGCEDTGAHIPSYYFLNFLSDQFPVCSSLSYISPISHLHTQVGDATQSNTKSTVLGGVLLRLSMGNAPNQIHKARTSWIKQVLFSLDDGEGEASRSHN